MRQIVKLCFCVLCASNSFSQKSETYRNFPVIVSVQFHSLSLPFRDLKSNFSNVGIGVGTEMSHSGEQNWVQQFLAAWYRNKSVGNGLLFSTQTAWRPTITGDFYTELKAGIGYYYAFRPVESYKPENGNWVLVGHKGKGMLVFPVGIGAGYSFYQTSTSFSPFVNYQLLILKGYNKSIPLVPETVIQAGTRIHF